MSRKQKNTDDFRLNSLVKKGEKVLKKRNDFRTVFFSVSGCKTLQCLVNRHFIGC